jgi:hypothetical protein
MYLLELGNAAGTIIYRVLEDLFNRVVMYMALIVPFCLRKRQAGFNI